MGEGSLCVPALGGAAAIGASMSQDTSVDDWNDVGRLDEAAAAGVPAALRQIAERDLESDGASDALQPAAQRRKIEIVEISDDEEAGDALSDDELLASSERVTGNVSVRSRRNMKKRNARNGRCCLLSVYS